MNCITSKDDMNFYGRSLIVIVILALTALFVSLGTKKTTDIPIIKPLNTFDKRIGKWEYAGDVRFQDSVVTMLGVDDYIDHVYESTDNQRIDLYVSYFSSLWEGKQFHSPKNCIVGSGSEVLSTGTVDIHINGSDSNLVPVNIMIMKNRGERQIVLYWFQCRGRYIQSEYAEKVYRVIDSIVYKRTDGAFIRIIATEREGEDTLAELIDFTGQVIPILEEYIPGSRTLSREEKI